MSCDLNGKTVLVTGATDGLGRGVAIELAKRRATVLAHGRDESRGAAVLRDLRQAGGGRHRFFRADFADLDEVRRLATEVERDVERLDVLVNNAGLGVEDQRRESRDGHELLFQVDYLAPFLLTHLLLPLLERSGSARVINVASAGQAPIDFDDIMLEKRWSGTQSYCQAKLADVMMAFDMAPELGSRGVTINALHPASMMPTKIVVGRYQPMSRLEDGVANVVRLAVDPALDGVTGRYFNGARDARADDQAYDGAALAKLREISVELTGLGAKAAAH